MLGKTPRGIRVEFTERWMQNWKGRVVDVSPTTYRKMLGTKAQFKVIGGLPPEPKPEPAPAPEPVATPEPLAEMEEATPRKRRRRRKTEDEPQA